MRESPRERLTFHFYWVLCFALHVSLAYSFLVTQSKRSAGTLKLFKTCEPPKQNDLKNLNYVPVIFLPLN